MSRVKSDWEVTADIIADMSRVKSDWEVTADLADKVLDERQRAEKTEARIEVLKVAAFRYIAATEKSIWERNYVDEDYKPARKALHEALGSDSVAKPVPAYQVGAALPEEVGCPSEALHSAIEGVLRRYEITNVEPELSERIETLRAAAISAGVFPGEPHEVARLRPNEARQPPLDQLSYEVGYEAGLAAAEVLRGQVSQLEADLEKARGACSDKPLHYDDTDTAEGIANHLADYAFMGPSREDLRVRARRLLKGWHRPETASSGKGNGE